MPLATKTMTVPVMFALVRMALFQVFAASNPMAVRVSTTRIARAVGAKVMFGKNGRVTRNLAMAQVATKIVTVSRVDAMDGMALPRASPRLAAVVRAMKIRIVTAIVAIPIGGARDLVRKAIL